MNLLIYILNVFVTSGILYSYYYYFLRNKSFHSYNRYYLLGSAVLAIVLPLISLSNLPWREKVPMVIQMKMYDTLEAITLTSRPEDFIGLVTGERMYYFL